MAETDSIARMAEKVSKEIFEVFGWTRKGPLNKNVTCVTPVHDKATHPSDVVFCYTDPYRMEDIYVNTDLKSYAKGTITKQKITPALQSLALSVECANKNPKYHELFVDLTANYSIIGMLFIYNHDAGYDNSLTDKYTKIDDEAIRISKETELYLIEPILIRYLEIVANDITRKFLEGCKPSESTYQFFYPNLITEKPVHQYHNAATIESIVGPWQIIRYMNKGLENFIVYSTCKGTMDECTYLIDYLFRYQLVGKGQKISIRMPNADQDAAAFFESAKDQYFKVSFGVFATSDALKESQDSITFDEVKKISSQFSETEIGMRDA